MKPNTPENNVRRIVCIIALFACLLLFNCSGRSQSGIGEIAIAPTSTGTVGVYLSNDLSIFDQVIASLDKIEIVNSDTGAACGLLSVPTIINIANSSAVLHLIDVQQCNSGMYDQIRITFNKSVQLMTSPTETISGVTSLCSFISYKDYGNENNPLQCDGPLCSLWINKVINIEPLQNNKISLDFDLNSFKVVNFGDPFSCEVTMKAAALYNQEISILGYLEGMTGLVSDISTTVNNFNLKHNGYSSKVNYLSVQTENQSGLLTLIQFAEAENLRITVLSSDLMTGGTVTASNIFVKIGGIVSRSNIYNDTFALVIDSNTWIPVRYSQMALHGTLADGAWVQVELYGYDGTDYLAIDPSFNMITSIRERLSIQNYGSLTDALSKIGAAEVTIVIDHSTMLSSDCVIPDNVAVTFEFPSVINLNNHNLSINGPFSAGLYNVFIGNGNITFGSGSSSKIYPEWWGAKGDGSTDDTANFQAALTSAHLSHIPMHLVQNASFRITSPLKFDSHTTLEGDGQIYVDFRAGYLIPVLSAAGQIENSLSLAADIAEADLSVTLHDTSMFSPGDLVSIGSAIYSGMYPVVNRLISAVTQTMLVFNSPVGVTYKTSDLAYVNKIIPQTNITLRNITIRSSVTSDTQYILYFSGCKDILVENVKISNQRGVFNPGSATGIMIQKSYNVRLIRNIGSAFQTGGDFIAVESSTDILTDGNQSSGYPFGIGYYRVFGGEIINNSVYGPASIGVRGLKLSGSWFVNISRNNVTYFDSGIKVESSQYNIISENVLFDNGVSASSATVNVGRQDDGYSFFNKITGNRIRNSVGYGIYADVYSSGIQVTGNQIYNSMTGVYISANSAIISDNYVNIFSDKGIVYAQLTTITNNWVYTDDSALPSFSTTGSFSSENANTVTGNTAYNNPLDMTGDNPTNFALQKFGVNNIKDLPL